MKELSFLHSWWRFLTGSVALLAILVVAAAAQAAAPGSSAEPASDSKGTAEVCTVWPFDAKQAAKMQNETAEALGVPKLAKVDLGGGVTINFVLIPAGKYKTGDGPGREVTVDKPFYMGKFAVTQAQYTRIMGKNPSFHRGRTNPADSINWASSAEFAKKASEEAKKTSRLPTEAEWEWACRAGTATRCYWGDDMKQASEYCWWHDNCLGTTHPVGLKKPNAFGLYDMMGNIWQWCYGGGLEAPAHPARGATFGSREPMFRATTSWSGEAPGTPAVNDRFGFRVVMDVE